MDGCQECLRESRGDRVMSYDERTCPEASTWHVQSLFLLVEARKWWVYGRWYLCTGTVHLLGGSLRPLPSWSPTTPLGASQTYSYFRVLCHQTGAPGTPPALPECFPSSWCSSLYEGVGFAADSAGLVLRQSYPSCFPSLWRSWSRSSLLLVVLAVPSGIAGFHWISWNYGFFAVFAVFSLFSWLLDLRGFLSAGVTSHKSSTLSSHQMSLCGQRVTSWFPSWATPRGSTSRLTGRIPTPVGVGILQAFLICMSPLYTFISFTREAHLEWNTFLLFKQKRHCTQ